MAIVFMARYGDILHCIRARPSIFVVLVSAGSLASRSFWSGDLLINCSKLCNCAQARPAIDVLGASPHARSSEGVLMPTAASYDFSVHGEWHTQQETEPTRVKDRAVVVPPPLPSARPHVLVIACAPCRPCAFVVS